MSIDGRLLFTFGNQASLIEKMSEDDEIVRNRGGIIYWNGSPKPRLLRNVRGRHIGNAGAPVRRSGEVRS